MTFPAAAATNGGASGNRSESRHPKAQRSAFADTRRLDPGLDRPRHGSRGRDPLDLLH
jgi:hypothetical protein